MSWERSCHQSWYTGWHGYTGQDSQLPILANFWRFQSWKADFQFFLSDWHECFQGSWVFHKSSEQTSGDACFPLLCRQISNSNNILTITAVIKCGPGVSGPGCYTGINVHIGRSGSSGSFYMRQGTQILLSAWPLPSIAISLLTSLLRALTRGNN